MKSNPKREHHPFSFNLNTTERERREKDAAFEVMAGLNDDVSVDIEEIYNGGKVCFFTHTFSSEIYFLYLFFSLSLVFFPLSISSVSFYGKLVSFHFSLLWVHSFPN